MSIQTELTRLQSAKAAIKTAIEGKGVTVPDDTLLNGMASLIESIEAGSGVFSAGTVTVTEDTTASSIIVAHNMGVVPKKLFWFVTAPVISKLSASKPLVALYSDEDVSVTVGHAYSSVSSNMVYTIGTAAIDRIEKTENSIALSSSVWIHSGRIPSGNTVTWLTIG